MKYTVKQAQATGKAAHPTYGTEYQVQFNEDDRIVIASKQKQPEPGDQWNGEIVQGKFGLQFKKDPFVPTNQEVTVSPTNSETTYVPYPEKRNDGARQGMCLNNAAASLVGVEFKSDEEWASAVWLRANTLFNKGDLSESDFVHIAQSPFAE